MIRSVPNREKCKGFRATLVEGRDSNHFHLDRSLRGMERRGSTTLTCPQLRYRLLPFDYVDREVPVLARMFEECMRGDRSLPVN